MTPLAVAGGLSVVCWIVLLFFRGGFWRADQRLQATWPQRVEWPAVVAVIPARDEAPTIGLAVQSILKQDYPGSLSVVVIDDGSTDGTATAAREADDGRLTVIAGLPLAIGWTGKLWAVEQGLAEMQRSAGDADFVLLTDADIVHHPTVLRRLVAKAEDDELDLVSLMVHLRCQSAWERLLIPAFVFFFQKLFPFRRVNDRDRPEAAAAGGCMLVRRSILDRVGGVTSIRDRLIDDCALAERIKTRGAIWLGLGDGSHSLRRYDRLADIWEMVARTAYTQLRYSFVALVGTIIGMTVIYLVPVGASVFGAMSGDMPAFYIGLAAWLIMGTAYEPTLRLYGQPQWAAISLPIAGFLYTLMTLDSARRHWVGRGGAWKGRTYDQTGG